MTTFGAVMIGATGMLAIDRGLDGRYRTAAGYLAFCVVFAVLAALEA